MSLRRLSALPALGIALCLSGCSGGPVQPEPADVQEAVVEDERMTEESSVVPLERHTVQIYFPSTLGNGLVGEYRDIFETVTPGDRAKQIVADLIAGPSSSGALPALPHGTLLRQAYVLEDGTAYLDFSAALSDRLGGGSMGELLAVYSIINSVVSNVPEIERVGILIDGKPAETLNGHLDLRRPLPPNPSLVLAPVVVELVQPKTEPITASFP